MASVTVGALLLAALVLTLRSLAWPLVQDAPALHFVAARLLEGAAPYRDIFDVNFPGVYLAHIMTLLLLGRTDWAFRVFDLVVLAGVVAGISCAVRSFGWFAAGLASGLFWLYHLTGGPAQAGQRDFLLCLPLAWMTAGAIGYLRNGHLHHLAVAGASLGCAATIKPVAMLWLPLLVIVVFKGKRVRRPLSLAVGGFAFATPIAATFVWLWWAGSLWALLDIVLGYLPLYVRWDSTPLSVMLLRSPIPVFAAWAVAGLAVVQLHSRVDTRAILLAAGVVYGLLHMVIQQKGFLYHSYPFVLFAGALGAAGLATAARVRRRPAMGLLLLGLLILMAMGLVSRKRESFERSWVRAKIARVRIVAATLEPFTTTGRSVLVLDDVAGGLHALFLLRAPQATRFLFDFPFYHHETHPYIERLRREFMDAVRLRPPAAVVLFDYRQGGRPGGFDRVTRFAELAAWLEGSYRLSTEGDRFRLYVHQGDQSTPRNK